MIDTIIIGGGFAGLSAALILGRCNRSVIIFDNGQYRNKSAYMMNGFLSRDHYSLKQFRDESISQLQNYNIKIIRQDVNNISKDFNGFIVNGINCKSVIFATGIVDILPEIGNIYDFWGKSVFICPICDAYEFKNKTIGVYGANGLKFALGLLQYSKNVIWFSNKNVVDQVKDIQIIETPISRLIGSNGNLTGIELNDRNVISCDSLFLSNIKHTQSPIIKKMLINQNNNDANITNIPGLFLAGDMKDNIHLGIIAAADGAQCAMKVNTYLRG